MIGCRKEDIVKEFERFGFVNDGNLGVVNLDVGVYFPYANQDDIIIQFALLDSQILEDNVDSCLSRFLYDDIQCNHRYPNEYYITASKRKGRKVCKTGYPIIKPICELNGSKWLAISVYPRQVKQKHIYCYPVSIDLSKDRCVTGVGIRINIEKPRVDMLTYDNINEPHKHEFFHGELLEDDWREGRIELCSGDIYENESELIVLLDSEIDTYSQVANKKLII
ncbi:MAG: hypothetical protein K6G88_11215 [Lachnospiraceae bacterium]|nr:hypothetical protein [Lachnospiraceae bacterium]